MQGSPASRPYSGLPSGVSIEIADREPALRQVRALFREYIEGLYAFIEPPLLEHRRGELSAIPPNLLPPLGAVLLASRDGEPLGCVGLRPAGTPGRDRVSELCRLFVTPAARGLSLGHHLVEHALGIARERGDEAIVLYSIAGSMEAAQAIYDRAGFRSIAPYKHVEIPRSAFYELDLRA